MQGNLGQKTWRPRRGPVFKALVWVLLVLIAGCGIVAAVIVLTL